MAKPRINPDELSALLSAGQSQAEAARHFGVSEAAVSLRVKQLKIATSKVVALERAAAVVDQKLSAADRLRHVQAVIQEQLTWAETRTKQTGADRPALVDVIVKLSAEIRSQLRLEHEISRTLIDLRVVREFQRTVFEEIARESPETGRRILERLKARRALRDSVNLPALDGRGAFDDI